MKLGKLQWAFIAVATATLIIMAPSDNESDSASLARPSKQRVSKLVTPATNSDKPRQETFVGHVELERLPKSGVPQTEQMKVGDPFNTLSWYVPPPPPPYVPPPPPPPPPPPTAPPLPFTYLGRYDDSASLVIILSKGDRVYTVAVGDVIENTYRVEKLSVGIVTLTYLPLNIQQSLRTGEAS